MEKVAIPITNNKLSEYLGQCSYYEVFKISKNKIIAREKLTIPPEQNIAKLPAWLAENNIVNAIAYKIDKRIINLFSAYRINLFVGIRIDTPQNLIESFINGTLKSDERIITEIID